MDRNPLIVSADGRQPPLTVVGTSVTVLASNEQTGGMGFTFQHGAQGSGPPPHCHPWDEAFYVLDGCVDFTVDGRTTRLEAGGLVHVPGGISHAFAYGPGGARMLEVTGEGSTAAQMFAHFDAEMPSGVDVTKATEIFSRHGAKLLA